MLINYVTHLKECRLKRQVGLMSHVCVHWCSTLVFEALSHYFNLEIKIAPTKTYHKKTGKNLKVKGSQRPREILPTPSLRIPTGIPCPHTPTLFYIIITSESRWLKVQYLWRRGSPKFTDDNVSCCPRFGFRTASPELSAPTLSTVDQVLWHPSVAQQNESATHSNCVYNSFTSHNMGFEATSVILIKWSWRVFPMSPWLQRFI